MEVVNNNKGEEQQALTNEQKLQYENNQLKAMLNNMKTQMEQMNMVNVFKRLDFLFKVIENRNAFSSEFVVSCVEEVEERMTIEDTDTEKKDVNSEEE